MIEPYWNLRRVLVVVGVAGAALTVSGCTVITAPVWIPALALLLTVVAGSLVAFVAYFGKGLLVATLVVLFLVLGGALLAWILKRLPDPTQD